MKFYVRIIITAVLYILNDNIIVILKLGYNCLIIYNLNLLIICLS